MRHLLRRLLRALTRTADRQPDTSFEHYYQHLLDGHDGVPTATEARQDEARRRQSLIDVQVRGQ